MDNQSHSGKYVRINPKLSAIELDLPENLQKYAEELREKIREKFSFGLMDQNLEDRIQSFIEDFISQKENLRE